MTQDELKKATAQAAIDYIRPKLSKQDILGIGTGSTANFFIDLLAELKDDFQGAVASSKASAERLERHGIEVLDLNQVAEMPFYIDGADEIDPWLQMIKGGGAALTREKIVAAVASEFLCIADESKWVNVLGGFPLPVEVIPMARSYVAREILALGGNPVYREGTITDNGNVILDVYDFQIPAARETEAKLNHIVGVVTNGLFARRAADRLFLGRPGGVETLLPK